jgi:4-diphosphocytidyl-2-C-methyl-D-erythritol kinase
MISFPKAKINLGLYIVSKRPDGFHDLETVFYPLPLKDVLEIIPSEETRLFSYGETVPCKTDDNLVLRSYYLLKKHYSHIGPLDFHLFKAIPAGAGLGGGSSDAVGTLLLIDRLFGLNINGKDLENYALQLGSDCPFFLRIRPCYATGRGEILEPIPLDLSAYSFLLIHPDIHIETAWAFSKVKPATPDHDLKNSIMHSVQNWKKTLFNAFEGPVFEYFPLLREIKDKLYNAGAIYVSMTGSGSTLFGIFKKSYIPDLYVENARQIKII